MATQKLWQHGLFGVTCSSLIYKLKTEKQIQIPEMYKEFERTILDGLRTK